MSKSTKEFLGFVIIMVGITVMISTFKELYYGRTDVGTKVVSVEDADNSKTIQTAGQNISRFAQMSQIDQTRISEIITGVIQDTTPITPDLKFELRSILKKYNVTDEEIYDFIYYGPALSAFYQGYFFADALQSISSGSPVKSNDRLNFEKEALSRGLMTSERIKLNDREMDLIARRQPVTKFDGSQVIFTENNIRSSVQNISLVIDRLISLFGKS